MNSRIFHGTTTHCRYAPRRHAFIYRMFWLAVDLDELSELDRNIRLFSHNRRGLVSILDRDYGGPGEGNIKLRILQYLERAGLAGTISRVELMTIPRIAGYVFNPVSFYLCSSSDGTIRSLVAEVRNTFGEMHHYVASLKPEVLGDSTTLECRIPKEFYVSPFFRVEGEYHIRIERSDEEFAISIGLHDQTGLVFNASMIGESHELDSKSLVRTLCFLPFFAISIMTRIQWQALRLYFARGLSMFEKPPQSHPSTVAVSHSTCWLRLRTAIVRWGVRRRPPPCLESTNSVPKEDSR